MAKRHCTEAFRKTGCYMCRWLKKKMKCFRFVINKCRLKFGHKHYDYELSYFPYLMG